GEFIDDFVGGVVMGEQRFERIGAGVYWLGPDGETDRPVLGVVVGEEGVLVVDGGNSPAHGQLLWSKLKELGVERVDHLVITHWHWDHIFGMSEFESLVWSSQRTREKMKEVCGWEWDDEAVAERVAKGEEIAFCQEMMMKEMPDRSGLRLRVPDVGIEGVVEIDLGGVRAQLMVVGGDHAADSLLVYVPEAGVVFLSDCLYADIYRGPYNYTLAKLRPLAERVQALEAEWFLWGHGEEVMAREGLVGYTNLLLGVGEVVAEVGEREEALRVVKGKFGGEEAEAELAEIVDMFLAGVVLG
ncbi:MAG TPA: MBL fold metallo-hydrolase, partial [Anaerolineae bacterium]|nr:MBL fold metallo-hydrolase [Anaerolineae bacterium]